MVLVAEEAMSQCGISPLVALAQRPYYIKRDAVLVSFHAKDGRGPHYLPRGIDMLTVTTPRTSNNGGVLFFTTMASPSSWSTSPPCQG